MATYVAASADPGLRRIAPARWRALADAVRALRTPAQAQALALLADVARALDPGTGRGVTPAGVLSWDEIDADLLD